MRYLYVIGLMLVTSLYTFSDGSGGKDDDDDKKSHYDDDKYKNDDDDDKYKSDDDDKYKNDDDDDKGGGSSNNNYLEVNVNSMCNFDCNRPDHIEKDQTIRNAVRLKFKTKNNNCSVYAKIGNYNYPSGTPFSTLSFYLKHSSNNSSSVQSLITQPIRLLQTDQRLFRQPKKSQTFQFYYDAILGPMGYEAPTGQYSFTVVFTMTQP